MSIPWRIAETGACVRFTVLPHCYNYIDKVAMQAYQMSVVSIMKYKQTFVTVLLALFLSCGAGSAFASECNDGIDNDGDGSCDRTYGACEDPNVFGGDPGCDSEDDDSELLPGEMMVTRIMRISHPAYTAANIGSSGSADWSVWNLDNTRIALYESQVDCINYKEKLPEACANYADSLGYGREAVWAMIADLKEIDENTPLEEYHEIFKPIPYFDQSTSGYPFWSPWPGEENVVYTTIRNDSSKYPENRGHVVRIDVDKGSIENVVDINAQSGATRCWGWSVTKKLYCSNGGQGDWSDAYIIDVVMNTKTKIPGGKPSLSEGKYLCDLRWEEWPEVGAGHGGFSPNRTRRAIDYGHANDNGVFLITTCESSDDTPDFVEDMVWEDSALDQRHRGIERLIYPHAASHVSWKASEDWFIVDTYMMGSEAPKMPELREQRVMQVFFDGSTFKYGTLTSHMTPYYWDDGYRFYNPSGPSCTPDPDCTYPSCHTEACELSDENYPYCDAQAPQNKKPRFSAGFLLYQM